MTYYESEFLTGQQVDIFMAWFDSEIGTETEVDQFEDKFSITFFEITGAERQKIKRYEARLLKGEANYA